MFKFTKQTAAFSAFILTAACLASCSSESIDKSSENKAVVDNVSIGTIDTEIFSELSETQIAVKSDDAEITGNGASFEDNTIKITSEGNYIISGESENIGIVVDTDDNSIVRLTLENVNLTSESGSVISVLKAKDVYISLPDDTENTLNDGAEYSSEDTDACIYSKSDLYIIGNGSLSVNGNYKHGIVSKDDLYIENCTLNVTSVKTGIDGKDSVSVNNADITVTSGTNGIRSSNSEDNEKGNISFLDSTVNIVSDGDCTDAENTLTVDGGTYNLTSGGGYGNASNRNFGNFGGGFNPLDNSMGNMGENPPEMPDMRTDGQRSQNVPNGDFMNGNENNTDLPENSDGNMPQNDRGVAGFNFGDNDDFENDENTESTKGLKAGKGIVIKSGDITVNSADDALHSNGNIDLTGGSITVKSGDDGVHADECVTVSDITLDIEESYEGIEGKKIIIESGDVTVNSSDDGINAADGSVEVTDIFAVQDGVGLEINGGNITVSASGDGIDSNGYAYFTAGNIYVSGPESDADGSLDVNGEVKITGGTFISAGSSGMAESFSDTSTNVYKLYNLSQNVSSGEKITITDTDGNTIIEFTPDKNYQSILFSSDKLTVGETVTLTAGSISEQITL